MKNNFLSAILLLAGFGVSLFAGNVNAQTHCKGALIVNEISNGMIGAKEFVELVPAACGTCTDDSVDISRWIIDDNNGVFSGGPAASGLGISPGHLRLTNSAFWQNFPLNRYLVLFNALDADSSNSDFTSALGVNFFDNGSAIFVAVGHSNLVERKTTTPTANTPASNLYCDNGVYTVDSNSWSTIGLRNSRNGDGIQVRCPGCTNGFSGEPSFYHGFSYGDTMEHVTNTDGFFDGAHLEFDVDDTIGGTNRSFFLLAGVNIGADANWSFDAAEFGSPGAGNTVENIAFVDSVRAGLITFPCCPLPVIDTTPVKGVLMITEYSNGPSGNCEYVELLVAACGGSDVDSVDIRGWIIDDNSGNMNTTRTCTTGVGISSGHLKLTEGDVWKKVPVGAILVLFNGGDNCNNFVDDGADNNNDSIYYLAVGSNVNVVRATAKPTTSDCGYCTAAYAVGTTANAWPTIGLGNDRDGIQVRCPGCTDLNPGASNFYHGISYGTLFSAVTATASDLGAAYTSGTMGGKRAIFFQGDQPGNSANWQTSAASTADVGIVRRAFRDSVIAGQYNFPCCAVGMAGASASPFQQSASSSNEMEAGATQLYPNPATDVLNIKTNRTEGFTVKIVDLTGKTVFVQSFDATQGTATVSISTSELPAGLYIYNISSNGSESSASGRLMIKR